ncbi:MAG: T9SS type A sorting domain-containing protein [Candidatus Latescibacterota bacterium]|nr:MAG: T9SS type A sorting domain-containing protein [Candidatus Latescibacterota bacterium]
MKTNIKSCIIVFIPITLLIGRFVLSKGSLAVTTLRCVFPILVLAVFVGSMVPPAAAIIFVDASATGGNNGSSWTDAYTNLQSAISVAVSGDTIWVAAGSYTPTAGLERNVSFGIKSGVVMYGGFAGEETSVGQRDFDVNPTILSGEIGAPGPDDNTYHVVNGSGSDSTGVIDGFVISDGNTDHSAATLGGGGMLVVNGGSPTIVNVMFRDNWAIVGGAMYIIEGASPTLIDVQFVDNTATGNISSGGAVRVDGSTPTFINVWFSGNTARLGGALYVRGESDATVVNTVFYNNIATDEGGTEGWGGGIYMSNSHMSLTNVSFVDNWADKNGGGLYSAEFGIIAMTSITNTIFWGNAAGNAGHQIMNIEQAITTIDHSLIQDCGGSGPYWDPALGVDAGNNIEADPFFADRANGDLRLLFASPAMEAGYNGAAHLPATDLDGKPRILGIKVDMGPYETTPVCPPTPVIYVDETATGARDGSSWVDAFTDLTIAFRSLDLCSGVNEIWVAGGSYGPAISGLQSEGFRLRNGLAVYGGFDGTESMLSQRVLSTTPSVLTGELGDPSIDDNTYHIVVSEGNDSTAVLDGFTITLANAVDATVPHGGGMMALESSPTICNVIFTQNQGAWGGGFYASGGAPKLSNVVFAGNNATSMGGGAAIVDMSGAVFTDVRFENNTSWAGGGLFVQTGHVVLINPIFVGNLAAYNGGAVHNAGVTMLTITNGTFYDNTGVYGGALSNSYSNLTVTNTIFWGNSGAEIYNFAEGVPVLSHSIVEGSSGSGPGWDTTLGVDGGNNLDADPLFASPSIGNLRLGQGSPAVDAGDNTAPYLSATDHDGLPRIHNGIVDMGAYEQGGGTGIDDPKAPVLPAGPAIRSAWPNPFNPTLTIAIELDRERHLRIEIYTIRGELVRRLENAARRRGVHRFVWDGTDDSGLQAASGVYLVRVESEGWRAHRKVVLLK